MKFSEKELEILGYLEMAADTPLSEISNSSKYAESTLRYHLNRFIDAGVIERRRVYIPKLK